MHETIRTLPIVVYLKDRSLRSQFSHFGTAIPSHPPPEPAPRLPAKLSPKVYWPDCSRIVRQRLDRRHLTHHSPDPRTIMVRHVKLAAIDSSLRYQLAVERRVPYTSHARQKRFQKNEPGLSIERMVYGNKRRDVGGHVGRVGRRYPKEVPALLSAEVVNTERPGDGSTRQRLVLTFDTPNRKSFEIEVWKPKAQTGMERPLLLTQPRNYQRECGVKRR